MNRIFASIIRKNKFYNLYLSRNTLTTTTSNKIIINKTEYNNNNNNRNNNFNDHNLKYRGRNLLFLSSLLSIYYFLYKFKLKNFIINADSNENNENDKIKPGVPIDGLPIYTLNDVLKHNDPKNKNLGVWIIYKYGVYDVTDFLDKHPGGNENLLLSAGNSIEPFWKIYRQHHTQQVYNILESYRIGNLCDEDYKKLSSNENYDANLFEFIPKRDQSLIIHHEKPFNAETPSEILVKNFYTPNDKFFIRNHLYVPLVDIDEYKLEIEGFGLDNDKTFEFSFEELKTLFPKHTVTSVVQCGGNRRDGLNNFKQVKGINWKLGAIGNARWSGCKLIDLLNYCHVKLDDPLIKHVQFEGMDLDATSSPYGASIPADKALDPNNEFILAYEMNGEPLPADHGYPIRLIAPGIVGARNVKWLTKIKLSDHESTSHWQRNDYKSFPSNKEFATKEEFEKAHAIQEMPIQSAICLPKSDENVKIIWKEHNDRIQPFICASGYAWSGGGRSIIRVDLSIDNGKTWYEAKLQQEEPSKGTTHTYSWTLWNVDLQLNNQQIFHGNQIQIICRAFDSSYNTQPSSSEEIWNFRGLLNNSWHRINVKID